MTKKSHRVLLFLILFGTMLLVGYNENIKGVSYPLIKTELGITYEQQGVMVSSFSLCFVLSCLIGGIVIGSFGVRKTFVAGFATMLAGIIGIVIPPILNLPGFVSLIALFVVVSSFGVLEVGTNALAAQLFTTKAALLLSFLHFFYGAGSILSPRVAGAIATVLNWRSIYLFSIPMVMLFLIPTTFCRFPQEDSSAQTIGGVKKVKFVTALKNPMVWIFSITLGIMVAVEVSSSNWAGLYFQDVYHMDPKKAGAAFISNYYILFTASRLVSGFAVEKLGYLRSLFIATLATIFILVLGFAFGAKGIYILPVLGFFTAVYWPTILATAIGYFKHDAPVMSSAIIVISGAVNCVIQFLIGLTNRVTGPAWGYRSCLVYAIMIVVSLVILTNCMKRPYIKTFKGAAQ